jgi:hypothetical protein
MLYFFIMQVSQRDNRQVAARGPAIRKYLTT